MTTETRDIQLPTLTESVGQGAPLHSGGSVAPLLGTLKVRLTAALGQTELTVAELTALKAGATLTLDKLLDQPIELKAEGHTVAQGSLVAIGDHFGIRISSIAQIS